MPINRLTRREFLKLGSYTATAAAVLPYFPPDQEDVFQTTELGRVTTSRVSVYKEAVDTSPIIRQRFRDDIVNIYEEITAEKGPAWNPTWYRVWGGYVHSAYIQKVKVAHQPIENNLRQEGTLAEVSVPYTQVMRFTRANGWEPLYRLYYETTHWVRGVDQGPDGNPWYRIWDELLRLEYFAPAYHLRLIPDSEFAPISPEVGFNDKRIEVSIARQTLKAYEKDQVVLDTRISSGVRTTTPTNGIPTETPKGRFNISVKFPSKHMGNGRLTDNLEDYELVGVPWTAFFHEDGYAIHGTYWHNNFGIRMSRGCINMRNHEARWLFRWMTPVNQPTDVDKRGYGTQLIIT